jgi:hypothetical protein
MNVMTRPVDFQLVRDGDRDLTFNGFVLAEAEAMSGPEPIHHRRAAVYQTLAGRIVVEFSQRAVQIHNAGEPDLPAARTGKAAVFATTAEALTWLEPGRLTDELRRKLMPNEPEFIE